jgi:hypothetical protein
MLTIYHYDETTGVYIGQGVAANNPKDPANPLIPAHSTIEPPPGAGYAYDAKAGQWVDKKEKGVAPHPVVGSEDAPTPKPKSEPVKEPKSETVKEPKSETVKEPKSEPVKEPDSEPVKPVKPVKPARRRRRKKK